MPGTHPTSYSLGCGVLKQPGFEINPSCQSGAEINNEGLYSSPPICLHDVDMGTVLPGC